jgi:hypothetical protein
MPVRSKGAPAARSLHSCSMYRSFQTMPPATVGQHHKVPQRGRGPIPADHQARRALFRSGDEILAVRHLNATGTRSFGLDRQLAESPSSSESGSQRQRTRRIAHCFHTSRSASVTETSGGSATCVRWWSSWPSSSAWPLHCPCQSPQEREMVVLSNDRHGRSTPNRKGPFTRSDRSGIGQIGRRRKKSDQDPKRRRRIASPPPSSRSSSSSWYTPPLLP